MKKKEDPFCEECGRVCPDCSSWPTLEEIVTASALASAFQDEKDKKAYKTYKKARKILFDSLKSKGKI